MNICKEEKWKALYHSARVCFA